MRRQIVCQYCIKKLKKEGKKLKIHGSAWTEATVVCDICHNEVETDESYEVEFK